MKTLINKANPEIRITAPDITLENHCYYIWTDDGDCIIEFWEKDWTLVEKKPVDLKKLALEKYPIQVAYLEGLKKGYELGLKAKKK